MAALWLACPEHSDLAMCAQSVQLAKVSKYLVVAIDEQLSSWCTERGYNVWYKDIKVQCQCMGLSMSQT